MGKIPIIVPGKLGQRRDANGKITGWKLQRWHKGRNETRYVPAALVERVAEGTKGHRRFMALTDEYAHLRGQEALANVSDADGSKKKPKLR
jgi:hypothetical protein